MNEYTKKRDDDRETAVKKKMQQGKDELKKKLTQQAEEAKRTGTFNVLERMRDTVSGRETAGVEGAVAKGYQKAKLEQEKENAKKSTIIKDSSKALEKAVQQADLMLQSGLLSGAEQASLQKKRDALQSLLNDMTTPTGAFRDANGNPISITVNDNDSNSAKSNKIGKLKGNKEIREKIIKESKELSSMLAGFYESGANNDQRFTQLKANIPNVQAQITQLQNQLNNPRVQGIPRRVVFMQQQIKSKQDQLEKMRTMVQGNNRTNRLRDAERRIGFQKSSSIY
jgi:hypothetical protein